MLKDFYGFFGTGLKQHYRVELRPKILMMLVGRAGPSSPWQCKHAMLALIQEASL